MSTNFLLLAFFTCSSVRDVRDAGRHCWSCGNSSLVLLTAHTWMALKGLIIYVSHNRKLIRKLIRVYLSHCHIELQRRNQASATSGFFVWHRMIIDVFRHSQDVETSASSTLYCCHHVDRSCGSKVTSVKPTIYPPRIWAALRTGLQYMA